MLRKSRSRKESSFNLDDQDFSLKPIGKKNNHKKRSKSSMVWFDETDMDDVKIKNLLDFFKIGEV